MILALMILLKMKLKLMYMILLISILFHVNEIKDAKVHNHHDIFNAIDDDATENLIEAQPVLHTMKSNFYVFTSIITRSIIYLTILLKQMSCSY